MNGNFLYNLADAFYKATDEYQDKIAIEDSNKRYRFSEVKSRVHQLSHVLKNEGVNKGDYLAIYSMNTHYYLEVFFACALLEVTLVPINVRLNAAEIRYILNKVQPKGLIVQSIDEFLLKDLIEQIPCLISLSLDDKKNYESIIRTQPLDLSLIPSSSDSPLSIIYTAAIDGNPKGAVLTQRGFLMQSFQMNLDLGLIKEDVHGVFLPLYHTFGLYLMCTAFLNGIKNVFIKKFDPLDALIAIQNGVSFFAEFSPMASSIYIEAQKQNVQLNETLRFVMGLDTSETIQKYLNQQIDWFNLYGQTETNGIVLTGKVTSPETQQSFVGFPTSLCRIQLRDDNGKVVNKEELGEICVRSSVCFDGYFQQGKDGSQFTEDGWLRTGDFAYQKEDGSYWYQGRKSEKELIKPGGENVYPIEVELVLVQHPDIEKVCVIGVPDAKWREKVKAVIQCKPNRVLTQEEIDQFCKERLASFKRPAVIEYVELLPCKGGIVDRNEVKRLYTETRVVKES